MKFAEHLSAHITPEWRKQYINYEEMKAMLYAAVEEAPSIGSVDEEVHKRFYANFDENFFHYCELELKKINTFYSEKMAEATRKYAALSTKLKEAMEAAEKPANKIVHKAAGIPHRKVQELKLAFSEFYLSLILLQNYQNLNHTGFRKILKKHDKVFKVECGAKWRKEHVETSHFFINKDIDRIIHETETTVTNELAGGDRQRAMKRLRVPPLGEQQSPWTTFKVAVVLAAIFHDISADNLKVAFRLYRGPLLIIEFIFLIGINVYGWRSSGVNHVLIFELDPRNHLSEQHLMELAAIFGVKWTLSLLSFLFSSSLSIPPYVNPLALTVLMIFFLLNPFKVFRHDARFWLIRISSRMIAAPFFHVGFADFWLADQLNSLVIALLDFQFLTCFYITNGDWLNAQDSSRCMENDYIIRPIVNCLPAWFRFAQCLRHYRDSKEAFPHLVNAGKYATTFLVVIFATLRSFHRMPIMKFAEHLSAHITPEWRKQYINYEEMKAMLYAAVEEAPSIGSVDEEVHKRFYANFDENFFHYCELELKKINTFYSEKMAEATRKYAALSTKLKEAMEAAEKPANKIVHKAAGIPHRKVQELKLAFSEFYLSLILLQNYQNLNHTGFRKILKKHDKVFKVECGAKWRKEHVETSHFFINKDIDRIIHETETTVTNELEGGDRQRAMKRLRVPPLGEQQSPWTTFKVGLFSGSFIVLFIAVVLAAIFHDISADNLKVAFRLYRGPLLIIEFIFLIGINVYGWRSSGVNHVLIFELDPRNHLSEQHLMELAAIFGVKWTLSLLSFLFSSSLSIPPYVNPLALTVLMIFFLLNPFKVFRHDARFWLIRISSRMISAPFFHVGFADFWLADQLNSLVIALLDFQFLTCFYITNGDWLNAQDSSRCMENDYIIRPIVNCLPAWFRFAQCLRHYRDSKEAFPHLVNAGKYATTFLVVIFATLRSFHRTSYDSTFESPYTKLWILCSFISSCYAYTWDIKMDWGLFDKNANENKFLREEVVYSSTFFYYFAIIEDFVLRFSWTLAFFLTEFKYIGGDIMTSIVAPLEVFRRFVWNFFRLENEHLNNCGKFRAVRDISIAPIDSSDQAIILRMIDDDDGVINRYKTNDQRPKPKKIKDPEKKTLLHQPLRNNSLQDLTIDMSDLKRL